MFKISEMFYSLQGEGHWVGTPMLFVRLSGCPVGGPKGICKTIDGRDFVCDTGKSYTPRGSVEHHSYTEINEEISWDDICKTAFIHSTKHICLTGGEPMAHNLFPIFNKLEDWRVHLETSGVLYKYIPPKVWVTVSPKHECTNGMIDRADEIKLLVDTHTTEAIVKKFMHKELYLQPVEDEHFKENTQHTIDLCLLLGCRLSLQTHKLLGLR